MNKSDLIDGLANKLGTTRIEAENVIDFLVGDIGAALLRGERLVISGFCTLIVFSRDERLVNFGCFLRAPLDRHDDLQSFMSLRGETEHDALPADVGAGSDRLL